MTTQSSIIPNYSSGKELAAPGLQTGLTGKQKQAVGLLSIGTFLEYFDLMLYVHMAVLLNELFFPKTDPFTSSLLAAFSFCTTFVFRPIGALLFGYIGDRISRKLTIIITTIMMGFSCVVMAILPTYAEVGIISAWLVTICRALQGVSSLGEIIGAEVYLTESIRSKAKFPAVCTVYAASVLGGVAALGLGYFIIKYNLNWRLAFWFGALVAFVGVFARKNLRETADFVDAKMRLKKLLSKTSIDNQKLLNNPIIRSRISKKTSISLFLMQCGWPVWFYITYFYCQTILKNKFGYESYQIIEHNFYVAVVNFTAALFWLYTSTIIYPMIILKLKSVVFTIFCIALPFFIDSSTKSSHIFLIQSFIAIFSLSTVPGFPIIVKQLAIFKRFTYTTMTFAISRVVMYFVSAFGIVYLIKYFGSFGLWAVTIPVIIGYIVALLHFDKLDQASDDYRILIAQY